MCVVVFKRRRKEDARIKELKKFRRKLETILALLNKKRHALGSPGIPIMFATSSGKDVERLVADALAAVTNTISVLELEEELKKKGFDVRATPDGIIIHDETFDHYAADAELAKNLVEEIWKEKKGEGGE